MKHTILSISAIILAFLHLSAQVPTNNPFSRYGIGELQFQGFGQNLAMGHTGIAYFSSYGFSPLNPASYSAMGKQHVAFSFAFNIKLNQFKTQDTTVYSNIADIAHIATVMPIAKWLYVSLGVMPYSAVGYNVRTSDTVAQDNVYIPYNITYQGSGSISHAFLGFAIKPIRQLSLGANLYYKWGNIYRLSTLQITEDEFRSATAYKYSYINSGWNVKLGALWSDTIYNSEKRNVFNYTIGAIYSPSAALTGIERRLIYKYTSYHSLEFKDTLVNDTINKYNLPLANLMGIGLAMKFKNQLGIELNYMQQNWAGLKPFDQDNLKNSQLLSFGMEYCRDPQSSKYLNTVRFRFGAFLHKTYWVLNNTPIEHYGFTFGLGLPARSAIVNFSIELGTKGTLQNNLFKENYVLFNLDLTIHDIWFIKRKFL